MKTLSFLVLLVAVLVACQGEKRSVHGRADNFDLCELIRNPLEDNSGKPNYLVVSDGSRRRARKVKDVFQSREAAAGFVSRQEEQ